MTELNGIVAKKVSESDYEQYEQKLWKRIEMKDSEFHDAQRMDLSDINSKLSTMKADISSAHFEAHVHNFLKDRVYTEFSGQISRLSELEVEMRQFKMRETKISQKLNESSAAFRLSEVER